MRADAPLRPIVVALIVACVWLNQSVGSEEAWTAFRQGVFTAPSAHVLDVVRYPFAYIYRRAADVRLYYELSSMMLGRRADASVVIHQHGHLPSAFAPSAFPPADGRWHSPYVEVPLEYPAAVLPFMLLPRLLVSSYEPFGFLFDALMGICLIAAVVAALDAARIAGVDARDLRTRAWLASALILAQGAVAVQRLDAVVALWIALAIRAAVRGRPLSFGAWAGIATATKILPALLVPAMFAVDKRLWSERRARWRFVSGFGTALAAGLLPMFVISGHALGDVVHYHTARGLQCESTLGLLLNSFRCVTGTTVPAVLSFGSFNLQGPVADFLASLCGPASMAASLGLAWVIGPAPDGETSRPRHGDSRIACAAFAAMIALWLTGKVFSPQYMTWGIPAVLAIPGALGVRLAWTFVLAMALTQFYLCGHYELVADGRALPLLNLWARQALLALAGYMAARALLRSSRRELSVPADERAPDASGG